ncbi:c-type cytochrome [Marilutibacter alkalisoli]|uniref:Cytochrome c n=1 Tax=Marilutibacter alkalisoli TaxID=2591633 RepID=A0A514BRR0_9GAMM|nr:cytochrome c [Lysobacter alkalisoli]QDH70061.1 cytochrome c [Lysobacter alkalisoli]
MNAIGKTLLTTGITIGLLAIGGLAVVYSGKYDVAADVPHSRPVHALLETARERSIAARTADLQVPADLDDPARIRQGSGNYDAMCTGCHLKPGMTETELSKGLYPQPPDLTRQHVDPAKAFWVIKHGIKASGMPAWGTSMDDEYIWNMAAFLQELPGLDNAAYTALVAGSDGHSHGGGETGGHSHAHDAHDENEAGTDHHAHEPPVQDRPVPETGKTHVHADGKSHVHAPAAPASTSETTPPEPEPKPEPETTEVGHDHHDHHH